MRIFATAFLSSAAYLTFLAWPALSGDFEVSGYGGYQTSPHSDITVSDGPDFRAGWDTKPFANPPYWGVRGTYWFDEGQLANWGISLDYTHAKVYADDKTLDRSGWDHFEFTDGLNLLTVNALYKFDIEGSKWAPYLGAGVGINVPHVEVTRASGTTFDYQLGGATVQAQAGLRYQFTDNWSAFAEYKGNYSWVDVDIDNGGKLKTEILTNAVNFGVNYRF
ncbi:outer membrane beta-barrel protein [Rhizobium sp.]|uniref:outer membrane protein n=1 Tax=Rhizobium sp. TaxID=391 RepID=UPI0028A6F5E3